MKLVALTGVGTVFGFMFAISAQAVVYEYNLETKDIATSGTTSLLVAANTGGDSQPIAQDGAPAGWGGGSFITNIDGATNRYSQMYINLQVAFNTSIALTLGDLKSITYYTKEDIVNSLDWTLRLYTKPVAGIDSSWYRFRFDAINPPGTTAWNQWDANTAGWFIQVSDRSNGGNITTSITKNLAELTTSYTGEILYFSLLSGSNANVQALYNGLDGIVVTLANDDQVRINLVPEPGSLALMLFGGVLLFLGCRRATSLSRGL